VILWSHTFSWICVSALSSSAACIAAFLWCEAFYCSTACFFRAPFVQTHFLLCAFAAVKHNENFRLKIYFIVKECVVEWFLWGSKMSFPELFLYRMRQFMTFDVQFCCLFWCWLQRNSRFDIAITLQNGSFRLPTIKRWTNLVQEERETRAYHSAIWISICKATKWFLFWSRLLPHEIDIHRPRRICASRKKRQGKINWDFWSEASTRRLFFLSSRSIREKI
jgi:hypothetical protein